ncbi:MAG TPA: alpha/beta hydrolase [Stellaceae bacterium]|jgi:pimeloyl-ACP methyl ester carboxylesterase|nr:alpha/beta hydrolase [Stellaceae bacterium]
MAEKRFANVGGLKTHYLQAGSGPALLMLHGQLPGSSAEVEFGGNIDHFAAAGYTVFAPDLAGFGLTDNPQDFSVEARIAHVEAFIAFMGLAPRAIWGSSMGTYIGCAIAKRDKRVERLVITPSSVLPPSGMAPRSETGERLFHAIHDYAPSLDAARAVLGQVLVSRPPSDELVQLFYAMSTGKNEEAERGRRAAGRPRPIHGELCDLTASSLLLWGHDDPSVPGERGLLLFDGMKRAEFHMLHDCGHWPQHDQPERTHRLVGDFLRAA